MALGYEGLVKIGNYYALGTGASVPRDRIRIESSAGYGGKITSPTNQMGLGLPFNYDWNEYNGSLNFEVNEDIFKNIITIWAVSQRQTAQSVTIHPRKEAVQSFSTAFWNSISISASEGSAVESTIGFIALERDSYVWGLDYIDNKEGSLSGDQTPLCPIVSNMPPPLNPASAKNKNPVPFWNTKVLVGATSPSQKNFTTWSLDFNQDVVKFFGCTRTVAGPDPSAQEPLFLAVGPMTVTFSGSYMESFDGTSNLFLGDTIDQIELFVASESLKLKRLELTSENDEVQSGSTLTPLTVDYAVYEIGL